MKYDKVIFLDIDGVLNSESENPRVLDKKAVARLKELVEKHDATIVVSSSWRKIDWPNRVIKIFKEAGWDKPPLADRTPGSSKGFRGEEIKKWLSENQVDIYIIIDDDSDMLPEQMKNFVKCKTDFGLTEEKIKLADKILSEK